MDNWLYTEVIKENDIRAPVFAWQSTINWMKALRFEIINEHGCSTKEQFESCVRHFKSAYPKKLSPSNNSYIFESLYKSLTGSLSLQTCAKNSSKNHGYSLVQLSHGITPYTSHFYQCLVLQANL